MGNRQYAELEVHQTPAIRNVAQDMNNGKTLFMVN